MPRVLHGETRRNSDVIATLKAAVAKISELCAQHHALALIDSTLE